jgi:hypothetical protein
MPEFICHCLILTTLGSLTSTETERNFTSVGAGVIQKPRYHMRKIS